MTFVNAKVWERAQGAFIAANASLRVIRSRVLGFCLQMINSIGFVKFRSEFETLYEVAVYYDRDLD